ncbi:DUF418 domain-containing protein [Aurantiacibacter hainanensis]|uniref:DUF418 domain-containing protein n=1 Tax=Aurantiacibacter hainanensis TaxID=3076114 RepID=UPI0030C662B9
MGSETIETKERIELVDALRGFALFGLLMVHMVERFELYWVEPRPDQWFDAVFAIFAGKSFAIFALLFGFSFSTIMARRRDQGIDFTARFAWRLILLFAIGTLHALLYRGDILQVLAIAGLLLIPFDRVRNQRLLLAAAALFFLQIPLIIQAILAGAGVHAMQQPPLFFSDTGLQILAEGSLAQVLAVNAGVGMAAKWSFYLSTGRLGQIAGLFILGMVLQRAGVFTQVREKQSRWIAALVASGLVWLVLAGFGNALVPPSPEEGGAPMQAQAMIWALDSWLALTLGAFQVCAFVLLWQPLKALLRWFVLPGRMTLTLYLGQSLVMVPIFYGFGLGYWNEISSAQAVFAGLAFFGLQILLATVWYRSMRYGPLEWIWRAATFGTVRVPMRRTRDEPM